MNAQMVTRNVVINGRRTTIRLETAVWDAFDDICRREKISRHDLCTRIENARQGANRAQAVRATVVNYYRLTNENAGASGAYAIAQALEGLQQLQAA